MRKTLGTLLITCLITIGTSCKKEECSFNETSSKGKSSIQRSSGENPLNYTGELHNSYLDIVSLDSRFPHLISTDLYNIIAPLVAREFPASRLPAFAEMEKLITKTDISQATSFMKSRGILTIKQEQLLEQLNHAMAQENNAEAMLLKIEALEKSLLSRNDMADKEKEMLLGAFSTARHSVNYWREAFNNSNSRWFDVLHSGSPEPAGLPKWIKTAIADVGGFLVGGSVQSVIENNGTYTFDLGGAVLGASIASAAAAA
jgi:hypothetical protein